MNQRAEGEPLPSCGAGRGQAMFEALRVVAAELGRRDGRVVWVNRSLCQGFCHASGVTLRLEPGGVILQGAGVSDVPAITQEIVQQIIISKS